jgi:starch phosphorylase
MARLTPQYSADRTVREYTEHHYLPCAAAYRERATGKGAAGIQVVEWQEDLARSWDGLRLGEVKVETVGGRHLFEAEVHLNGLDPNAVRVEIYADGVSGGVPLRQEMERARQLEGGTGGYLYCGSVSATRPASDYTVRVIPRRTGVAVPLEEAHILWQR